MVQLPELEKSVDKQSCLDRSDGEFIPATISDNAAVILDKRYFLKDTDGAPLEDANGMFRRVADSVAEGDRYHHSDTIDDQPSTVADRAVRQTAERFYRAMSSLDFLPNSPTLMNAGTGQGTLSACFVLPLRDTMEGIAKASHDQAMVQKFGGGTGFALSDLRPKGWSISTTHGRACGPVEVLRYLSATSRLVTQGGKRDGANMAVMNVHHPDIEEFIACKEVEGEIHNFNISVGVTDEFMRAVESGSDYPLYFRADPADENSEPIEVDRLDARQVFDKIIAGAWLNGEPGMIFLDEVNRHSPVKHVGMITATNPCGEQPLLPNESCNLGSINLAHFVKGTLATSVIERDEDEMKMLLKRDKPADRKTPNEASYDTLPSIDWERLEDVVRLAVHFLDNTIDVNEYAIPEIESMNRGTRKIGLGVMGFADMLVQLGIPYDSDDGVAVGRAVMQFIKQISDDQSEQLAIQRGPYDKWHGGDADMRGEPPMRNACRLTVAPTGTISMIAGCSSGIEPIFSLAYRKHNILGGDTTLYYADANLERVAKERGFYSEELLDALSNGESLQDIDDVSDDVKSLFHVASNISPRDHVLMQAAFQESVDAGISKTINFPNSATKQDVEDAYMLAWKRACKGITVYRAGSREKEVLTAGHADEESNDTLQPSLMEGIGDAARLMVADAFITPMKRPPALSGRTVEVATGRGKIYVTLNYTDSGRLFEVFTAHGKAGGNDNAMAEALSRMISLSLRSGVSPDNIVRQLRNISDVPHWSNGTQIKSVPDAIAQVIAAHSSNPPALSANEAPADGEVWHSSLFGPPSAEQIGMLSASVSTNAPTGDMLQKIASGESCPECFAALAFEEGCMKCYSCGFSKC